jgi:saccharopine dehydrogenase (NAD+, L-lysine-forming)
MNVVVLGGAGVIGSYAVQCLTKMDNFSKIRIADANEKAAREFSIKNDKVEVFKLDATDEKSLLKCFEDMDVVVNCIGPFYKFAPKILSSSIKSGIHYVDVCDDFDTTEILIDNYNQKANDAGTTCIVGLGASPGLTNIIAAYSSSQLSSVETIKIYVTRSIQEESGGAIPYHMLHCWLGRIPIFQNGEFKKVDGLIDGKEYADFPTPFGQTPVYYFGHPETVTLPRYIKNVKNVCCKGSFFPTEFREILLKVQSLDLLSEEIINVNGQQHKIIDFTAKIVDRLRRNTGESAKNMPQGGSVMVEVSGLDEGQPRTIRYSGKSYMREGTATPAAIGAKMLALGDIKKRGVFAPEGCVPPEEFIANMLETASIADDIWITFTQKFNGSF